MRYNCIWLHVSVKRIQRQRYVVLNGVSLENKEPKCTCHRLPRGGGGGPWADVGTLLIVHFKVLVFPHLWWIFLLAKSPVFGEAKHPIGFEDALQNFILVL